MPDHAHITGRAVPLRIDNLDTDQIMPKQFLRGIDKAGLAAGVLYDLRHGKDGEANPNFILNTESYRGADVLIGGSNFGCGSSREHAVWGLLQYGFRAIVASSFAEIFYSNAMGNRLLLIQLEESEIDRMVEIAEADPSKSIDIDISAGEVRYGSLSAAFPLSERHREMFLKGVDVIGMSLSHKDEISAFAQQHWARQPWMRDVARRMKGGVSPHP